MSTQQAATLELQYIDSDRALKDACSKLQNQAYLAIDTEFVREKTYYPILCLIQIASPQHCFCIDPLTITDLSPLAPVLLDEQTTKVFHAARQDLEILQQTFGHMPRPVFDTQIAATLLGLGDQISYARLVSHFTNIQLAKGHARTDWQRRPLSQEQLDYAADDVRHLVNLYPRLRQALDELGRLAWLEDDFAALCDPRLYENDPQQQWQRVSGLQKLRGVQLAILQHLAAWREDQAQQQNKPRKWILSDDILLTIAMQAPTRLEQLDRIRGINSAVVKRHGRTLLDLVATAKASPSGTWPALSRRKSLDSKQEALLDALQAIIKLQAAGHQISNTALTSRHDLESLLGGNHDVPLLHGWRRGIAGQQVLNFLEGKMHLAVADQGVLTTINNN